MLSYVLSLATTPSPKPFDENTVTPGWEGFAFTFGVGVVVILLIVDMTRRIRRAKYRGEIREKLEAEQEESDRRG